MCSNKCLVLAAPELRPGAASGQFILRRRAAILILGIATCCGRHAGSWPPGPIRPTARLRLCRSAWSARQFRRDDFVCQVDRITADHGALGPFADAGADRIRGARQQRGRHREDGSLRARGVQFALMTLATGCSSLSYPDAPRPLHAEDHQSFVRHLGERPRTTPSQTIIGMGRNLDLAVIAEGVKPRRKDLLAGFRLRPVPGLPARAAGTDRGAAALLAQGGGLSGVRTPRCRRRRAHKGGANGTGAAPRPEEGRRQQGREQGRQVDEKTRRHWPRARCTPAPQKR